MECLQRNRCILLEKIFSLREEKKLKRASADLLTSLEATKEEPLYKETSRIHETACTTIQMLDNMLKDVEKLLKS